ncbi:MAG TPA: CDP-alcohol phosphatidyltransferase family protein [Candidatus Nanoarchaeia archaeon]|nr:CDP-alcohol phosphatidyltransferase family protein [Candidatus Nanoarchaeia archaeon]
MDIFKRIIVQFRTYRRSSLRPPGQFLAKIGITPNIMTALSLLCGLAAVYFLFQHYLLFLLFGLLHLLADALDGVIASITRETALGKYFDYGTDNLIALLLVLKIGYFLHDYYAYLVAGLYLLAQLVFLFSKLSAPVLFGRSVSLIALFFYIPVVVSLTSILPVLVYLFMGVIAVYSLARQLQWFLMRTKSY